MKKEHRTTKPSASHYRHDIFERAVFDTAPISTSFVETFVFSDPNVRELGTLYFVGHVSSTQDRRANAALLAHIADALKGEYFRNPDREPREAFAMALERANTLLRQSHNRHTQYSVKLNIALAAVQENVFWISNIGNCVALATHARALATLWTPAKTISTHQTKEQAFKKIIHGTLAAGEHLVIGTANIFKLGKDFLAGLSSFEMLRDRIEEHTPALKNLGVVAVRVSEGATETPQAAGARTQKEKPKALSSRLPSVPSRYMKIGAYVAALATVIVVIIFALGAHTDLTQKRDEAERLIYEMRDLNERTAALVELGNMRDAEATLTEWDEAIEAFEILNIDHPAYNELHEQYMEHAHAIRQYTPLERARTVVDLSDNAIGFTPQHLALHENRLTLAEKDTLYEYSLQNETGSFSVLPAETEEAAETVRAIQPIRDGREGVVILTGRTLLYRADGTQRALVEGERIAEAVDIAVRRSTVYVLTPRMIYAIDVPRDSSETELREWLETDPPFESPRSIAVDQFVYVLDDEGTIHRLFGGDTHSTFSADPGVTVLFTTDLLTHLYALDPENGTVVVHEKTGSVVSRLIHDNIAGARSLSVSQNERTLMLIRGTSVLSFGTPQ